MDWPGDIRQWGGQTQTITLRDPWALGYAHAIMATGTPAVATWTTASKALFIPFRLPLFKTVYRIEVGCGSGAGGNFDAGVYDEWGNRLVSTGATARVASSEVIVNVTDTVLGPGLYYMALVFDATTTSNAIGVVTTVAASKAVGMYEMASAYPLPDPVTFAANTTMLVAAGPSLWLRP
jgi:hypothetical protein